MPDELLFGEASSFFLSFLKSCAILSRSSLSICLISSCLWQVSSFSFCLHSASLHSSSAHQRCPLVRYSCAEIFFTGTDSATFHLSIGWGEGMHMSGEVPSSWPQSVLLPLHALGLPAPLAGKAVATIKLQPAGRILGRFFSSPGQLEVFVSQRMSCDTLRRASFRCLLHIVPPHGSLLLPCNVCVANSLGPEAHPLWWCTFPSVSYLARHVLRLCICHPGHWLLTE